MTMIVQNLLTDLFSSKDIIQLLEECHGKFGMIYQEITTKDYEVPSSWYIKASDTANLAKILQALKSFAKEHFTHLAILKETDLYYSATNQMIIYYFPDQLAFQITLK